MLHFLLPTIGKLVTGLLLQTVSNRYHRTGGHTIERLEHQSHLPLLSGVMQLVGTASDSGLGRFLSLPKNWLTQKSYMQHSHMKKIVSGAPKTIFFNSRFFLLPPQKNMLHSRRVRCTLNCFLTLKLVQLFFRIQGGFTMLQSTVLCCGLVTTIYFPTSFSSEIIPNVNVSDKETRWSADTEVGLAGKWRVDSYGVAIPYAVVWRNYDGDGGDDAKEMRLAAALQYGLGRHAALEAGGTYRNLDQFNESSAWIYNRSCRYLVSNLWRPCHKLTRLRDS